MEAEQRAKVLADHKAEQERLAAVEGGIAGTAFVNLKSGDHKLLTGVRISLLKAEIPKERAVQLLEGAAIPEGIYLKPGGERFFEAKEVDFFNSSLDKLKAVRDEPGGFPVDVRLLYALDRVNTFLKQPSPVWPDAVKTSLESVTHTSVEGEFGFEGVRGGTYYLWATYSLPRSMIEWVSPVRVDKPGVKFHDLHNETATLIINID